MQSIKLRFVNRYKKAVDRQNNTTLWQRRFWDYVIRNAEDLHRQMGYVHYNPVKHGYVSKPSDYRGSLFKTHEKMGNYAANWGTDTISESIDTMNLE